MSFSSPEEYHKYVQKMLEDGRFSQRANPQLPAKIDISEEPEMMYVQALKRYCNRWGTVSYSIQDQCTAKDAYLGQVPYYAYNQHLAFRPLGGGEFLTAAKEPILCVIEDLNHMFYQQKENPNENTTFKPDNGFINGPDGL